MRKTIFTLSLLLLASCQTPSVTNSRVEEEKATLKKVSEAYKQSGDMQSAVMIEQKMIMLDQGDEKSFRELAKTLRGLGKTDEAFGVLKAGMDVLPDSDAIKLDIAKMYLDEYQQDPALEILANVKDKQTADYYDAMGVAADLNGQSDEAESYYTKGLAIDPNDENLRNNLAVSYIINNDADKGVAILEELIRSPYASAKYKPKYRQNLALGYGVQGRAEKARKILGKDLPPQQVIENLGFYRELGTASGKKAVAPAKTVKPKAKAKPAKEAAAQPVVEEPKPVETPEVEIQPIAAPKKHSFSTGTARSSTKAYLYQ